MTIPLRTRKPTAVTPYPLILIEGAEKAGKSWSCAQLSASEKVGQTYWIDLGEGSADEYGAIPGARYLIVDHDGSYRQIYQAIAAIYAEAQRAHDAKEPPVVLVIDSMSAEWELLKGIADGDARRRYAKKNKREASLEEELKIDMDLWVDANTRHRRIMNMLMTFPGIVVMTARGKETVAVDNNGRPIPKTRDYKVEGQKNLAYDATVWLRVSRDHPPLVVGARSVHAGIRPGVDRPKPLPDMTLEKIVFDILGCDTATMHTRDLTALKTNDEPANVSPAAAAEIASMIAAAGGKDEMTIAWRRISAELQTGAITEEAAALLSDAWHARKSELLAPAGAATQTGEAA